MQISIDSVRNTTKNQFNISWSLLELHLNNLGDEECLWEPCQTGLHVKMQSGKWRPDWPESEGYEIGAPNIAWLTWHIIFWWEMVFDYSFDKGTLKREDIQWPGTMEDVKKKIFQLRDRWAGKLDTLPDEDFICNGRTKWPFENKPFFELAAWLNAELMKNAAEIGYCRFLYAARNQ